MGILNSYFVRSADGEVIEFRRHRLAPMAETAHLALQFEPHPLAADHPGMRLAATLNADGFAWKWEPAEFETKQRASNMVVIVGRSASTQVALRRVELKGEMTWGEWPGCDLLDILVQDADGEVGSHSLTLRVPTGSGAGVDFQPVARGQIHVVPKNRADRSLELHVWRRVQNDLWLPGEQTRRLMGEGVRDWIPAFHGAFIVTRDRRGIEGIQFFAHSQLHSGTLEEVAKIEALWDNTVPPKRPWEDFPTWVEEHLVTPLVGNQPNLVNANPSWMALRTIIRSRLLGRYLPADFNHWAPEQTIEEFVAVRWPVLAPHLDAFQDEPGLRLAFANAQSPLLGAAIILADGNMEHFSECLAVAQIDQECRRLQSIVPAGLVTAARLDDLVRALKQVPQIGAAAERSVLDRWALVEAAVWNEFGTTVGRLTTDRIQEHLLRTNLEKVSAMLKLPWPAPSLHAAFEAVTAFLESHAGSPTPGLVEQCLDRGLLPPSLPAGQSPFSLQLGELGRTILDQTASGKDLALREAAVRLAGLAASDAIGKAVELENAAGSIGPSAVEEIRNRAAAIGVIIPDAPPLANLEETLRWALEQDASIDRQRAARDQYALRLDTLRSRLPNRIDPESPAAAEWIAMSLEQLIQRCSELNRHFWQRISFADRQCLDLLKLQLTGLIAESDYSGIDKMEHALDVIRDAEERLQAIVEKIAAIEAEQSGLPANLLVALLKNDYCGQVELLSALARKRAALFPQEFLSLKLSWLVDDPMLRERLVQAGVALWDLEQIRNEEELRRIYSLVEELTGMLSHWGGEASMRSDLVGKMRARLQSLSRDLLGRTSGAPYDSDDVAVLGTILKRAGLPTFGPGGPPTVALARLPQEFDQFTPELLRQKLREHQLWPMETGAVA